MTHALAIMDDTSPLPHDMTIPYFVLMAMNIYVIAPIGLWLTKQYNGKRHDYRYRARRPKLVIFYNLFALFFVSFYMPLHIIFFEILWDNNNTVDEWFDSVSYASMMSAVSIALSLRIWHSFYDFQLAHYSSRQWKSILRDDIRSEQQSLLPKYKRFLGLLFFVGLNSIKLLLMLISMRMWYRKTSENLFLDSADSVWCMHHSAICFDRVQFDV